MIVRKSHLEACLKSRSDEAYFVPGVQCHLPVIINIIILIAVDDTETIKRWGWLQTSVIQSWQGHFPDRRSAGANPQPWMVMMMMAIMTAMMAIMTMMTMMMMMMVTSTDQASAGFWGDYNCDLPSRTFTAMVIVDFMIRKKVYIMSPIERDLL